MWQTVQAGMDGGTRRGRGGRGYKRGTSLPNLPRDRTHFIYTGCAGGLSGRARAAGKQTSNSLDARQAIAILDASSPPRGVKNACTILCQADLSPGVYPSFSHAVHALEYQHGGLGEDAGSSDHRGSGGALRSARPEESAPGETLGRFLSARFMDEPPWARGGRGSTLRCLRAAPPRLPPRRRPRSLP